MPRENSGDDQREIISLIDLPDNVVFARNAVKVTEVDVPLTLEDGTVVGKARVVEGDDNETTVLIELEATNPIVAGLFKSELVGMSISQRPIRPAITQ